MADAQQLRRDLWKRMTDSPFVMVGLVGSDQHHEPLTVQLDKDQVDTLFFFIGKDNRIAKGGKAMVQFASKGHDYFACLAGNARISDDRAIIDKLWSDQAEAWFPGGKHDPNLALLRIDIDDAELWERDISLSGRLKKLVGAPVQPDEAGSHAKVSTTAEGAR